MIDFSNFISYNETSIVEKMLRSTMKLAIKMLLLSVVFLFSSLINVSFADDNVMKFKLEIKPNQQKVEAKIDGDEHKQVQIKAEYVKLNTVTNNHHIKVTITNNSGQILYHQLALIDKVEHSEIKYPDSTTDYIKTDDGKQIIKTLPYYNYGNIKPMQATPREWYLSNTGKDEIEIEGYIVNKEIPVALDPKLSQLNPSIVATLTTYLSALRDNDLDAVIATLAKPDRNFAQDLPQEYTNAYNKYPGRFSTVAFIRMHPTRIEYTDHFCYIFYDFINPDNGLSDSDYLSLEYDNYRQKWWITF